MCLWKVYTRVYVHLRGTKVYMHISLCIYYGSYIGVGIGECMGCKQHCVDVFTCEWDE